MKVAVVVALPGRQDVIELELAEGATIADAVEAAAVHERFPDLDLASVRYGVWGELREPTAALREADRVEIYRPLVADPKQMRRARAALTPARRARSGR